MSGIRLESNLHGEWCFLIGGTCFFFLSG